MESSGPRGDEGGGESVAVEYVDDDAEDPALPLPFCFREVGGGESNRAPWSGVGGTRSAREVCVRGGVFIVEIVLSVYLLRGRFVVVFS